MQAVTLLYHDVIEAGSCFDSSGREGSGPASFKLRARDFDAHLDAIDRAARRPPVLVTDMEDGGLLLTFDDGGVSAHTAIAPRLEERGWRGHFFVTSDCIGDGTHVTESQIRDLADRGHIVGSHSATHPVRMSHLSPRALFDEWSRSVARLSEILGEPVQAGSVAGGYYSEAVGRAAAAAGLRYLFTSEPTRSVRALDGCLIVGRFALRRQHPASRASGFASGRLAPLAREAALWRGKKVAKAVVGDAYLRLRARWFRRGPP